MQTVIKIGKWNIEKSMENDYAFAKFNFDAEDYG